MADIARKSVTAGDIIEMNDTNGTVINLMLPSTWMPQVAALPTTLLPYWSPSRDVVLGATVHHEAMWAAALDIAITKVASKSWEVKSGVPLRTRKAQALLLFADGVVINDDGKMRPQSIGPNIGWVQFLGKHLRNFLCADNGSFVEIIREKKSIGSRIMGLRHLSSARCTRTGDPEIPVVYRDKRNQFHELKDYQVMTFVDMPDPDETWNGVGLSAAARSYPAIYKLMAIERYVIEKVTGLKPLAIYIVNGIIQQQLDGAIKAAKEQQVMKGLASYMGAVIIGTPSDKAPEVATIPLAELPDRFSRKEELDLALLTYSNNIGLDPQELQPLSGQGLGTGTQAQILDDKASGKGLIAWQQQWTHQLNQKVLDDDTTFIFIERDYRDMKLRADVTNARASGMKTLIDSAIITPEQGAQIMADLDEIPKEFVPEDLTPGDILSDIEKPDTSKPVKPELEEGIDIGDEEEAEPDEGESQEEPEAESGDEEEAEPEPESGEDGEYEKKPLSEEFLAELQKKMPKKKKELGIDFMERDILDVLRDRKAGADWAEKPLAIMPADSVKAVTKSTVLYQVKNTVKELGGTATFTAIHEKTKIPYADIFGAVQYFRMHEVLDISGDRTAVKQYEVRDASELLNTVKNDAQKRAIKMILAAKLGQKHYDHNQKSHGNRYSHKPPTLPVQLNNASMKLVQERQMQRVSTMEATYPGVKFSSAVNNPLGVAEAKKLGMPGAGTPGAIYSKEKQHMGMEADTQKIKAVIDSFKKWKSSGGYIRFNTIKYDTGLDFDDIFRVTNYLRSVKPESVRVSVDRSGNAVNVSYQLEKLEGLI